MLNQRWRDRRDSYRPAGEVIRTGDYEVSPVAKLAAKVFVQRHHYSGTFPAARRNFGLHRRGELVGVAVFSQPMHDAVLRDFPGSPRESVELGRFVLLDDVPANGETWFLGRAFELLRREGFVGVISFSDDQPRAALDGRVVFGGHVGTIYQAHNGIYCGRGRGQKLMLLPDGSAYSHRAETKIRNGEQGREYASRQLVAHGAAPLRRGEDPGTWLARWKARLTRAVKHPGCHKYIWAVDKRARRHIKVQPLPYPKFQLPGVIRG